MTTTNLTQIRKFITGNPLILPLYLPSVLFAIAQAMLIPVLPVFAESFNVSYVIIGLALASMDMGQLIADVPSGVLLSRLGQRRSMLLGALLAILSTVPLFWAQSIYVVIIGQLLSGFGLALFMVGRLTYLAGAIDTQTRGRATSLLGGVFRFGWLVGPALGGFIAKHFGLASPFLVYGLFGIAALLLLFEYFPKENPEEQARVAARSASNKSHTHHLVQTVKENKAVLLSAGLGQLFGQLIRAGRRSIIPLYATVVLGLDVDQIGLILSVAGAFDLVMFIPAGIVMDRFGRKFAIVPCFALQSIGMLMVPFTTGFLGLLFATSFMGFWNGIGAGTMMTLGSDLAPPGTRGEFLGVWRLIGDVGFTAAPLAVGVIAHFLVLSLSAWALAGSGFLAAGIFAFYVPETLKKSSARATQKTPEATAS